MVPLTPHSIKHALLSSLKSDPRSIFIAATGKRSVTHWHKLSPQTAQQQALVNGGSLTNTDSPCKDQNKILCTIGHLLLILQAWNVLLPHAHSYVHLSVTPIILCTNRQSIHTVSYTRAAVRSIYTLQLHLV